MKRHTTPRAHATQQPQHTADHQWHALSRAGKLAAHNAVLTSTHTHLCQARINISALIAYSCKKAEQAPATHPAVTCLCCGLGTDLLQLNLQRDNVTPTTPHATPRQHTQQTIGGTPREGLDNPQLPSTSRSSRYQGSCQCCSYLQSAEQERSCSPASAVPV
jgi:hypothetical protein